MQRLLDAGVFAPIGFLLTRDRTVTDLATAGRKQIAFSRSLGRAALNGLVQGARAKRSRKAGVGGAAPETTKLGRVEAGVAGPTDEVAAPVDATVADYDTLTAREIIAIVREADEERIAWIRATESAGKQRVTVLRAAEAKTD